MIITINDKNINLKFGFGFLRVIGAQWGCNGPVAITDTFFKAVGPMLEAAQKVDIEKLDLSNPEAIAGELPFDTIDVLVDIVEAAAKYENNSIEVSRDDIAESIFQNPETMGLIIAEFLNSLPRVNKDNLGKLMERLRQK